jgi:hypothetical protein
MLHPAIVALHAALFGGVGARTPHDSRLGNQQHQHDVRCLHHQHALALGAGLAAVGEAQLGTGSLAVPPADFSTAGLVSAPAACHHAYGDQYEQYYHAYAWRAYLAHQQQGTYVWSAPPSSPHAVGECITAATSIGEGGAFAGPAQDQDGARSPPLSAGSCGRLSAPPPAYSCMPLELGNGSAAARRVLHQHPRQGFVNSSGKAAGNLQQANRISDGGVGGAAPAAGQLVVGGHSIGDAWRRGADAPAHGGTAAKRRAECSPQAVAAPAAGTATAPAAWGPTAPLMHGGVAPAARAPTTSAGGHRPAKAARPAAPVASTRAAVSSVHIDGGAAAPGASSLPAAGGAHVAAGLPPGARRCQAAGPGSLLPPPPCRRPPTHQQQPHHHHSQLKLVSPPAEVFSTHPPPPPRAYMWH